MKALKSQLGEEQETRDRTESQTKMKELAAAATEAELEKRKQHSIQLTESLQKLEESLLEAHTQLSQEKAMREEAQTTLGTLRREISELQEALTLAQDTTAGEKEAQRATLAQLESTKALLKERLSEKSVLEIELEKSRAELALTKGERDILMDTAASGKSDKAEKERLESELQRQSEVLNLARSELSQGLEEKRELENALVKGMTQAGVEVRKIQAHLSLRNLSEAAAAAQASAEKEMMEEQLRADISEALQQKMTTEVLQSRSEFGSQLPIVPES